MQETKVFFGSLDPFVIAVSTIIVSIFSSIVASTRNFWAISICTEPKRMARL